MSDPLERVLRPIVEGQMRSFINDHPEVVAAVDWYRAREDKVTSLVNSVAKRILRDLLCAETRVRLVAALVEDTTANAASGGVEVLTAPSIERGGIYDCPVHLASVGRNAKRQDRETGLGPKGEHATAAISGGDAQTTGAYSGSVKL